ncbi:hypothetical protein QYF36_020280 [Acer negundo]|nr:hypothetical protein QYF36_020280 [Acer negundo]
MAAIGIEKDISDDGNATVKKRVGIIVGSVIFITILLVGLIFYIHKRKHKKQGIMKRKYKMTHNDGEKEEMDLWIFDFNIISKATDNFSNDNKLGEGGFGPVYKGILTKGQEIAVKRLSKYFGMARIFGENEIGANTNKVVGTYGYMSPEYAVDGLFSITTTIFLDMHGFFGKKGGQWN